MSGVKAWAAGLVAAAAAFTAVGVLPAQGSVRVAGAQGVTPLRASATSVVPGPFFTFLFSRTEMTAAISCVPNSTSIARLGQTHAQIDQRLTGRFDHRPAPVKVEFGGVLARIGVGANEIEHQSLIDQSPLMTKVPHTGQAWLYRARPYRP